MNKIVLQLWEESGRKWGVRPDGCSIHIDSAERDRYVESIYSARRGSESVPEEYDRIVGSPIESYIDDALFETLKKDKSIRLAQHEMNNLVGMEDLIIRDEK
jgi:hypothetical protein